MHIGQMGREEVCNSVTALIYCDETSESRNSGIRSEVDFLGNELLRQLHDNS
jgi:hypothetical protein